MFKLLRHISIVFGEERAQRLAVALLRLIDRLPCTKWVLHKIYAVEDPSLEREVFGMRFKNPIGMAAGLDRNGEIFRTLDALGFGFVEIGTVTPLPQQGNPRPRVFRLPDDRAILNRIGLASKGLERVICNLRHSHKGIVIGCNIGKNSVTPTDDAAQDYLRVFRNLYQYVDYFTVNVSYNTTFKQYVPRTRESVCAILEPLFDFRRGQNQYRPILLKISPDLTNDEVDTMTDIMMDTPLDGIVATNATTKPSGLKTASDTLKRIGDREGVIRIRTADHENVFNVFVKDISESGIGFNIKGTQGLERGSGCIVEFSDSGQDFRIDVVVIRVQDNGNDRYTMGCKIRQRSAMVAKFINQKQKERMKGADA